MRLRLRLACAAAAALALALGHTSAARAATGVCDSNPPTTTDACTNAVQGSIGVVNDIFKDANGLTGPQLPVFGSLVNQWPGCADVVDSGGCAGTSLAPYDCPGQYSCATVAPTLANAKTYVDHLDRLWWQPCRLAQPALAGGCPQYGAGCIADGVGGSYLPWEGLVFDLGGQSNKVAIFAENDHGPQPCESFEYTVYLTNNPYAQDLIQQPTTQGVDPNKWNRAVLSQIFTKGFVEVRPPDVAGHGPACGDTAQYSVEEDSFVQVFSLPCGVSFRYASIIAGNDALDFPACGYDSSEAELDAVAGLTEGGQAVCPDADGDLFSDCNCPGAPPVCDCNDADPSIHPGAPEACDAPDLNCDGVAGACSADQVCYQSICVDTCAGEIGFCPGGSTCTDTAQGKLCVPQDCVVGGCPPGSTCNGSTCVPLCNASVVCPAGQVCQDGNCVDPCANIVCPNGLQCLGGKCEAPCRCFAGDLGCTDAPGTVCQSDGTCVPPMCVGVACTGTQHCDPASGTCVDQCTGVACPAGQVCKEGLGCVSRCDGVTCDPGFECDATDGTCVDVACIGQTCTPPKECHLGQCVDVSPDGGPGGPDGGAVDASMGGDGGTHPEIASGCSCRAGGRAGHGGTLGGALAAGLALVALTLARRRR